MENESEFIAALEQEAREALMCGFVTASLSTTYRKVAGRVAEAKNKGEPVSDELLALLVSTSGTMRRLPTLPGVQPKYGHKTAQTRSRSQRESEPRQPKLF